ncbi:recombination protein NinG [Yersinia ruckeri]|uniref:recombination protein NinG n=1 Tax=Yersinia ruckeri TaxID=29486 RepID=UPI0008FD172B|nr:recombination protein NinG [Yersinia ruckeri]MCW6523062.1 recombination protein NinG [Yersinia ruckeri]MCW6594182.1 recombination protein NinG [Yersinia ruckeri]MCW6603547.1 recombination protein NinG [Yersinia ruckeri]OIX43524.1 protein ninG [Yersinia ruckeri]OJC85925.1 protein ninG [Yersinia ruckeri]
MAKLPKSRNCKVCKTRFKPAAIYEWWCCEEHKEELITKLATEARQKRMQQQERQRKETTQQERRSLKVRKLAVQPLSYFAKQAQTEFNAFIRERDADLPCISCGRFHDGQYHAGHYRTVGANPELRFNEDNCHRQCAPCNNHLSGNIENYTPALREKIGEQAYQLLMGAHEPQRYRREDFERIRDEYKVKRKALKQLSEAA